MQHQSRNLRHMLSNILNLCEIPPNAQIVLQVEGDDQYNEWSRQSAERQENRTSSLLCEGEGPETGQINIY